MKPRLLTVVSSCVIILSISSCKKQLVAEKDLPFVAANSPDAHCKVMAIGLASRENNGGTSWSNLLVKWYDASGQLKNVKFALDNFSGQFGGQNVLAVDYGEVTFKNDEVVLRDIFYNQEILRAKLDAQKRPIVSWYNSYGRTADVQYDTSYYTYSAANRLASITRHMRLPGTILTNVTTWNFSYDPDGNLVTINPVGSYGGFEYRYDYTRLNKGFACLEVFSAPSKMLEFMDLLKFEHHHEVSTVIGYESSGYPARGWGIGENVQRDSEGKVIYYDSGAGGRHSWYTAWSCSGTSMLQSRNPTQEEFMKIIKN